jgi:hypothetical protein
VQRVVDFLYQATKYGPAGCNVGKALMDLRLRDTAQKAGKAESVTYAGPPRVPQPSATAEGQAKLKADLETINFFGSSGNFA